MKLTLIRFILRDLAIAFVASGGIVRVEVLLGDQDQNLLPGRMPQLDLTSNRDHNTIHAMPTMIIANETTPQLPEISVFRAKVNSVSDKANVNMKWLVLSLLKLAEDDGPTSQEEKLRMVLAKLFEPQPTNKISTVSLP